MNKNIKTCPVKYIFIQTFQIKFNFNNIKPTPVYSNDRYKQNHVTQSNQYDWVSFKYGFMNPIIRVSAITTRGTDKNVK